MKKYAVVRNNSKAPYFSSNNPKSIIVPSNLNHSKDKENYLDHPLADFNTHSKPALLAKSKHSALTLQQSPSESVFYPFHAQFPNSQNSIDCHQHHPFLPDLSQNNKYEKLPDKRAPMTTKNTLATSNLYHNTNTPVGTSKKFLFSSNNNNIASNSSNKIASSSRANSVRNLDKKQQQSSKKLLASEFSNSRTAEGTDQVQSFTRKRNTDYCNVNTRIKELEKKLDQMKKKQAEPINDLSSNYNTHDVAKKDTRMGSHAQPIRPLSITACSNQRPITAKDSKNTKIQQENYKINAKRDNGDSKSNKSSGIFAATRVVNEKGSPTNSTGLSDLITQFPAPNTLLHVSSQGCLLQTKEIINNTYYVSRLFEAFDEKTPNTSFAQLCRSHLTTSLQVLAYTSNLQIPSFMPITKSLPPMSKPTIVFDLDQTLIHCNESLQMSSDVVLDIVFPNGERTKAGINIRPYAIQCLRELSSRFQLIVFTASHECYANVVIDYLDPEQKYVAYRYFRDSCYKTSEGLYIKDLRVIDRPLENMLLIDNAAYSYAFQLENGVPIVPFYDSKTDFQLCSLVQYLKSMTPFQSLKTQNMNILKNHKYPNFTDPIKLLRNLYKS